MAGKPQTRVDDDGRVCTKCRTYKTWNAYHADPSGTRGHRGVCIECDKVRINGNIDSYAQRTKRQAMDAYGGICACCSEANMVFLTIDHIAENGADHRREIGSRGGGSFYLWLKQNDYPEGFQVLCFNCNHAKHVLGVCPHQEVA